MRARARRGWFLIFREPRRALDGGRGGARFLSKPQRRKSEHNPRSLAAARPVQRKGPRESARESDYVRKRGWGRWRRTTRLQTELTTRSLLIVPIFCETPVFNP